MDYGPEFPLTDLPPLVPEKTQKRRSVKGKAKAETKAKPKPKKDTDAVGEAQEPLNDEEELDGASLSDAGPEGPD